MSRFVFLAAVAVALFIPETALADAEFADPAGDGGGAPDIASVFVANDSSGLILFSVDVPSHATLDAMSEIQIVIDSDLDAQTGDDGWDHSFYVNGSGWGFQRWDGAQWVDDPTEAAGAGEYDAGAVFVVHRSALGDTSGFNFYLASYKVENGEAVAVDVAPDGDAVWSYSVVAKKFGIAAGPLVRAPKAARAGKAFTVGFLLMRTDWPLPADEATVICTATLGGKKIRALQAYDGIASCQVKLPANAKGKQLKIVMRVLSGGQSVTRTYTTRVK